MSNKDEPNRIERLWHLKYDERDKVWPIVRLMWWLLGILFIAVLLLRMAGCGRPQPEMGFGAPWESDWRNDEYWSEVVRPPKPIDPGDLIPLPGDGTGRRIVENVLNLYLEQEVDLREEAEDLVASYPTSILGVMTYAEPYKRLTLRIEEAQRKDLKARLKAERPEIRFIFDESVFSGSQAPADPGFSDSNKSWAYQDMGAWELWKVTEGSPDVTIAVIDNMFEGDHVELQGQVTDTWNTVNHNAMVRVVSSSRGSGHGTHVAGSVAGAKDNGVGVSGTAPGCSLMLLQVADVNGYMLNSAIVDAMFYASNAGATVINMSLGMESENLEGLSLPDQEILARTYGSEEAAMWDELYAVLEEDGITVVQAAGNSNILADIDPMKRSKRTVVVGATRPDGKRVEFSNFGQYVSVYAPGKDIYSSVPGGEDFMSGTSMASPLVAGVVGILKSARPDLSTSEVIRVLQREGVAMDAAQTRSPYGGYRVCMSCLVDAVETTI